MHNNIMAAGSKERPPDLGPGRYLSGIPPEEHSTELQQEEEETIHNDDRKETNLLQAEKEAFSIDSDNLACFAKASPTQAWLWHRRLSHLNFDYITLLSKKEVVTGLPKLKYVKDQLCSSCEMSKAKRKFIQDKQFLVIVDELIKIRLGLFSNDPRYETPEDSILSHYESTQSSSSSYYCPTDRGTEFLEQDTPCLFQEEGIVTSNFHSTTPEQNGGCGKTKPYSC
ncbi:retrovirus-related pol polyprotein from transposon TNT 1-94 [Tanacetum coccineum]